MTHAFDEYKDTPLWRLLAAAVAELEATREIRVATAPDYVVGYLCERLVAARLTTEAARQYAP